MAYRKAQSTLIAQYRGRHLPDSTQQLEEELEFFLDLQDSLHKLEYTCPVCRSTIASRPKPGVPIEQTVSCYSVLKSRYDDRVGTTEDEANEVDAAADRPPPPVDIFKLVEMWSRGRQHVIDPNHDRAGLAILRRMRRERQRSQEILQRLTEVTEERPDVIMMLSP